MTDLLRSIGASVVGIYLHGSIAFGCTHPASRDIDLLVVTRERLRGADKRRLLSLLLERALSPCAIEATFLAESQLRPWRHPCAYDLHYGEDWRERISQALRDDDLRRLERSDSRDIYLAAHVTNTVQRGRCLFGRPAAEAFPAVPREDYEDFLVQHLAWGLEAAPYFPVYAVLTSCRALAFFREGRVLSKAEGALWAIAALPQRYHATIADALESHRAAEEDRPMGTARVRALLKYVAGLVGAPTQVTLGASSLSAAGSTSDSATPVPA